MAFLVSVRQKLFRILIATAVVVGGMVTMSPPASAATCSNQACDYLDPYQTSCANDQVLAGRGTITDGNGNGNYGTLDLMWSPTCQTNWGIAYFNDGNPNDGTWVLITVSGTDGGVAFEYRGTGSPVWGDMIYSPDCANTDVERHYAGTQTIKMGGFAKQFGC
jgi:hypothetical protein